MRFLFGLLLVLVLLPAGFAAPCCEAAVNEACCPLDRDCTADEGRCPAAPVTAAIAPVPFAAAPAAVLAPTFANALPPVPADPAPPFRALRGSRCLPLRN